MKELNKPVVSVCVQTYQHAPFIRECLDSILMQKTDFPFEIILGEDESTDGTREICVEYAKKYPEKIRLFLRSRKDVIYINRQATGRYNFTENLKAANGQYIGLLEGDDYWTDPLKLQKQVNFLQANNDFVASFHETKQVGVSNENGRIFGETTKDIFYVEDTLAILSPFHTSSLIFCKDKLQFPDWYCKVVSADMALFSIVSRSGPIKPFHEVMSMYRKHEGGITNSDFVISSYHHKRIELMRFLNDFHEGKYQDKVNEVINFHEDAISRSMLKKVDRSRYWRAKNWLNRKMKGAK